ncbi:MAG: hypothetical protein JY451_14865 [Erythrobacter sp.]|nr:MAG: hypothetical protein JY451_14865 [Erythrobacter sp.]
MKPAFAYAPIALAAALLSACATLPDAPIVSNGPALPVGSGVALGQPVEVASNLVVTPMEVTEDSRCPINARCIWPGQIVVQTRVDGAGWRETVALTMGEPASVRGRTVNLTSAEPGLMAGEEQGLPGNYRFTFEAGAAD